MKKYIKAASNDFMSQEYAAYDIVRNGLIDKFDFIPTYNGQISSGSYYWGAQVTFNLDTFYGRKLTSPNIKKWFRDAKDPKLQGFDIDVIRKWSFPRQDRLEYTIVITPLKNDGDNL